MVARPVIVTYLKLCSLSGFMIALVWLMMPRLTYSQPPIILDTTDVTIPVIDHPTSQEFPDVDGRRVVWQDFRFGPTDIFLRDLTTGVITNLTQSATWEVQPDLDGDLVVWKDGYNGIGIHGLNLVTGQIFTVTEGHSETSRPHLSGNLVVWADNRAGGDDWNIYGYNVESETEFTIADAPGSQQDPRIDGNYVVWWDYQEHVYLYDVSTQQTTPILDTWGARLPDVSQADNVLVWQDFRNGNWDIYGYDLTSQTEITLVVAAEAQENPVIADGLLAYQSQVGDIIWNIHLHILADGVSFAVTNNSNAQVFPAVDETTLVWQDSRNHQTDIYHFTWTGDIPPPVTYPLQAPTFLKVGAFPDGQLQLHWQETITNETGFRVERTTGITGATWQEIATLPANTTVYTDRPGVIGESYWYRIRAYNSDGFSAYTNDSFNSTFDTVPSPDEQYLMVLVNETRFAPATFGYPEYNPVPPLAYNPNIAYSARSHSQSILNSGFQFGHCDPTGRCPRERAIAAGYPVASCGENLTTGGTGPAAMAGANQGFMDSEGHRNNMMAADLNEFGVGHTYDPAKGDYWRHGQFTQVFCGRAGVDPPVIPMGAVIPYTGTSTTVFTYAVNFYNSDGQAPTLAQVVINGQPYPLSLSTGTAAQGTYRYPTTLDTDGSSAYYFLFEYGAGVIARWPETGAITAPDVHDTTTNLTYLPLIGR